MEARRPIALSSLINGWVMSLVKMDQIGRIGPLMAKTPDRSVNRLTSANPRLPSRRLNSMLIRLRFGIVLIRQGCRGAIRSCTVSTVGSAIEVFRDARAAIACLDCRSIMARLARRRYRGDEILVAHVGH